MDLLNCHFIVIIATYIICQLVVNSLGDEFVTTSFNFRKRKKKSLSFVYLLHNTSN